MPTVLANALLSFVPDASVAVRASDRVGVVSPLFNEEAGAAAALESLLGQSEPIDQLAVSVNGGTDATLSVVASTLTAHGYSRVYEAPAPDFAGRFERWHRGDGPSVVVLDHAEPISKADSINAVIGCGYITTERVLVVDGDTIFAPTFVERLKDQFYRLRVEKRDGRRRYVIEDSALQSGSVMSLRPPQGHAAFHISRAREGEYAVAALLRSGQTARIGKSQLLGQSRLYTVVGCGFAARRDSFPMPADTLTEDHDFTLQVQNEETTEERLSVAELQARGFKVRTKTGLIDAAERFDKHDEVILRRSANARFVPGALMFTEDPLTLPGYMRQVERWNGGGVENAIKRARPHARKRLRPNVAFAAWSAQFENLFGIGLLLFLLPAALGVNSALPGYGTALTGLGAWLAIDLLVTLLLVGLGFRRLRRAQGERGWQLVRHTTGATLRASVPLLSMRLFNAVAYVVAFTRALPKAFAPPEVDPRVTITWERPRAVVRSRLGARVATVAFGLLLGATSVFFGASYLANNARPGYKATWLLINTGAPMVAEEHVDLPLLNVVRLVEPAASLPAQLPAPAAPDAEPTGEPLPGAAALLEPDVQGDELGTPHLSAYCSVGFTASPAASRRLLSGDPDAYVPLTYWQRLILARLTPLAAHLEEAATSYDVPPRLLLQILINESFLDPLAVGPTEDLGLSQVTGDALSLLRSISSQPDSRFANPVMFAGDFNVFDPDFSICAGAAKLAWSRSQPNGHDDRFAYARYINPLEGVRRSGLNPVHAELVVALDGLVETVDALRNTFAAYRQDPDLVTAEERALLDVYEMVAQGELALSSAYLATHSLIKSFGIDDGDFYQQIGERLYGAGSNTVLLPEAD
ncbi:MAG: transglycosylase SLT domain-containing protein [Trueperaceae bacterium]